MKINGQLGGAQLEGLASDPTGTGLVTGRAWFNTGSALAKVYTGSASKALLFTDGVFSGTLSAITTKGDLLVAQTSGVLARLPVGVDGQVVTADSTQASGVKWANASGGGGGALKWVEDVGAPAPLTEYNNSVYAFSAGLGQSLYALIKVPTSYSAGNVIKILLSTYSADTTGTVQFLIDVAMYRPTTDPVDGAGITATSTNGAITLGAGTVNKLQPMPINITDNSGLVGGFPAAAGYYIKIRLYRSTDTSTQDAKIPVYGAEVTFT